MTDATRPCAEWDKSGNPHVRALDDDVVLCALDVDGHHYWQAAHSERGEIAWGECASRAEARDAADAWAADKASGFRLVRGDIVEWPGVKGKAVVTYTTDRTER